MEGNIGPFAQADAMSGRNEDTTRAAAGEPGGFSALQREREGADVERGQAKGTELKEAFGSEGIEGASNIGGLAADYGKFPGPEAGAQGRDDKELQEKSKMQQDEAATELRRQQQRERANDLASAARP